MESLTDFFRSPLFWVLAAIAVIVVIIVVSQNKKASEKKTETFMATHSAPTGKADQYCHNCGSPMRSGARYCPNCGASTAPPPTGEKRTVVKPTAVIYKKPTESTAPKPPADPVCPFCESLLPPGAALCPACGNAVSPAAGADPSPVRTTPVRVSAPASRPGTLLSKPDDSDL